MTNPPKLPEETLMQHASGLRSLAVGLLGEEQAAEDVLQETLTTAIERPPPHHDHLRGWLHRVARSLALKRRRSDGRRRRREEDAACTEEAPSVDELMARRQVLRDVVDAVLGLEEPYQSVILMRYYADRSPRAIAEISGVPLATVDSRLHRALKRLRARLDRKAGGDRTTWSSALALVTGLKPLLPVPAPAVPDAGAGTGWEKIAMEWKLGLATMTTGIAVMAGVPWGDGEREAGDATALRAEQDATEQGLLVAPAVAGEGAGGERVAPPLGRRVAVDPGPGEEVLVQVRSAQFETYTYELEGVVIDEHDLPRSGALVHLGPLLHPSNVAAVTDPDGRFRVSWKGRAASMEMAFEVMCDGVRAPGPALLQMVAGETQRLRVLAPASRNTFEVLLGVDDLGSDRAAKARVRYTKHKAEIGRLHRVGFARKPAPGASVEHTQEGLRFTWPTVEERKHAHREIVERKERLHAELLLKEMQDEVVQVERRERKLRPVDADHHFTHDLAAATLRGVVRDGDGNPVEGAILAILSGARGVLRSAADGSFELQLTQGGTVEVRAGGGEHGILQATLELEAGKSMTWEPVLERGTEIRGELVDEEGQGLDGWVVEFVRGGGEPWSDRTRTRDGSFAIPNVPAGTGELYCRPANGAPVPAVVLVDIHPGPEAYRFVVPAPARSVTTARVGVRGGEGHAPRGADVVLWQESTGRGARLAYHGEEERYVARDLPQGRYRLTLGTAEHGYLDLGSFELTQSEVDLGSHDLPTPGELRLGSVGANREIEWALQRTDGAWTSLVASGHLGEELSSPLPVGSYALVPRGKGFVVPPVSFTVRPGERTDLSFTPDSYRAFDVDVPAGSALELQDPKTGTSLFSFSSAAGGRSTVHLLPGTYVLGVGESAREVEVPGE